MPYAPQASDREGRSHRGLTGHDRADPDHVIGIRGVAHPEKGSQQDEGENLDHGRINPRGSSEDAARRGDRGSPRGLRPRIPPKGR
jgi:hypothetical protein